MAELAISAALALAEIIIPPLLEKLNLESDVKDGVRSMQSWLRTMNAFIEDNYGRQGSSRLLDDKMDKVRDIAYEIEDILDEFLLHTSPYMFHNHRITKTLHQMAHNVRHGFPHREIYKKIEIIKKDMDDIRSQHAAFSPCYSNQRASTSQTRVLHRVSHLILDHDVVGYEKPIKQLIHQLMDSEKNLVRLAVVGPGGSGKTTIVKNVHSIRGIWGQFDCHAWVHVSSHFDVHKLSNDLLKQFRDSRKEPCPSGESSDKLSTLRNYLRGKRFIVVLDDIRNKEQWVEIKDAFPNSCRGSRIIFTIRSSGVAAMCATSPDHVCSLKNGLEWLEGWRLFCMKAFPDENGECPSEMKDISTRIVKRCEGLPLAIVAVGGTLAQKPRRPNEWERFHDSFGFQLGSNSDLSGISQVLLSGYMDLASNLKSCFLYFGIFPEDYSVKRGRLIRLWVAEGFVKETDGLTAEEVAEEYLNELIHRNLVHVSNWDFDGRPRNCRVLNIVLQFIIQKCKDENFVSIFPRENTSQIRKIRRLSLHNGCSHLQRQDGFCGVRSMFLLRSSNPSGLDKSLCDFKLLKVLDLQGALLTEFPKELTDLTLLRYLSLRDTNINMIPSSIKKLSYLETLDLRQTNVRELPKEIFHLHNLLHLFVYKYNVKNFVVFDSVQGVEISEGIHNLTNLQDLSLVKVDRKGRILKHLQELSQLRKLGIMGLKVEHGGELCASIEHMQKLRTLDLSSATKEEYLELGKIQNSPRTLERLYFKGRLHELPRWISSLHNLLRIGLNWSKMKHSPLKALQHLPNLIELQLVDSYIGNELTFEASGFKKLKILLIEDFVELHTIVIQQGALPKLTEISLRRCPKLKILPLGIDNLAKVEEMILHNMDEEFLARLRKKREDRELVEHIPVIHSFALKNQSWSFENLSASFLVV